jgi:thioesterase domain-containing protein
MPETPSRSEAKRALVEKYLRGDVHQAPAGAEMHVVQADAPDGVVPIHIGGSQIPVFFLHGQYEVGGGFYCFRLARALGLDRPFYALEPYRFGASPVPPSLNAVAAAHVKSLRAVVPEGPYILGGWCNGALLAYEMARQLQAEGQRVEQVVLIDPVCLQYPAWLKLVRAAITGLGKSFRVSPHAQLEVYLKLRHRYRYMRHLAACIRSPGYRRSRGFGDFIQEDYPGIYDWTAMDYRPSSLYLGKITFFWSSTRPSLIHGFRVARFRRGWRGVEAAGAAEVRVLPFGHWTCLSDHLDLLAERLNESLIEAMAAV